MAAPDGGHDADLAEEQTKVQLTGPQLAIRFGVVLRKAWGGSRAWVGARAQSVLMSAWRPCWQLGRLALDFLSQLLRGAPTALALPREPPGLFACVPGRARENTGG